MDDEYGIKLLGAPGAADPAPVYFEAVDDEHALMIMAERWDRGEVLSLFHYPRGHELGTQRRVWPKPRV